MTGEAPASRGRLAGAPSPAPPPAPHGRGRLAAARALAAARLVPDVARLAWRLLRDPRVPRRSKLALALLAGYLALPFDLVPDFIPVLGQLDDALVALLVLRVVLRGAGREVVAEQWPGTPEGLATLLRLARL